MTTTTTTTKTSKTASAIQHRPLKDAEASTSRPREASTSRPREAFSSRPREAFSAGAGEGRNEGGSNEGCSEGEGTADSHASGEGKAVTEGKARRRFKEVWMVEDRPEAKSIWTRVGTAFENQDGSWNIRLSALPVGSGRLNMRDPIDRSTRGAANSDQVTTKAEQVAA